MVLCEVDAVVSESAVIIAVPKGNPKHIRGLKDLAGKNLRIAAGQPKQCTIGVLTREILKSEGLLDDVMKNVVAETCSSALLLPMVTTGSVDAAFVYQSDILGARDQVDAIRIPSPKARAVQPFSIARTSQQKWLSRRFFATLARHKERFEAAGFRWLLEDTSSEAPDRE
jgi:molybdate transport system substrate-binding protein